MPTLRLCQIWHNRPHYLNRIRFVVTSFTRFKVFGRAPGSYPDDHRQNCEFRREGFESEWVLERDAAPRVSDLEWRTLSHGCQRFGAESSRLGRACGFLWVPAHEHSGACAGAAVCWEFPDGRRKPCAVCDLARALVGERTPLEWYSLVWQAGDEGRIPA